MPKPRNRHRTHYAHGSQPQCWTPAKNPPLTTNIALVTCQQCLRLLSGLNSGNQQGDAPRERVHYTLSPSLIQQVAEAAKAEGIARSAIAEQALANYLEDKSRANQP